MAGHPRRGGAAGLTAHPAGDRRGGPDPGQGRETVRGEQVQGRARPAGAGERSRRAGRASMSGLVGQGVARVDGRAKVTGAARYAADQEVPGVLHGALVMSTIARGEVLEIDRRAALAHPGVVAVHTHADMPRLNLPNFPYNRPFIPMQDTRVHHHGQPVAYVVAQTLEQAQEAADLVKVRYRAEDPVARMADVLDEAFLPDDFRDKPNEYSRGDAAAALGQAAVRVDRTYSSPMQHHNPIEPHTTTAVWEDDGTLTLYESTQGVVFARNTVQIAFGMSEGSVRVVSPPLPGRWFRRQGSHLSAHVAHRGGGATLRPSR
ncbi:xanthine dehydrogenase family protein molybdopterin-binding subunit [Nonomuraea ferruginea]